MSAPEFPDDENGAVLRRMHRSGDDLTQPRVIDFCFAFAERRQALAFAETVDDQDLEVCISYYEEREMWQAIVKRYMVPAHREITMLESTLTAQAECQALHGSSTSGNHHVRIDLDGASRVGWG